MKIGDLAQALDLECCGNPDYDVERLASLSEAGPTDLAFAVGAAYRDALAASNAGAVITTAALASRVRGQALVTTDPYGAYARASWLLHPEESLVTGVHPSAVVAEDAVIAADAAIGAGAVIEAGAQVGDGAVIGAHCWIGRRSSIGPSSVLFPRVTVYHDCHLGHACRVQSGAVIGAEGFGYAPSSEGWQAIHQHGGVRIGNRVHIGANTTIDRGAINDTTLHDGVILDNQIQIAHNVEIGENTAIAGCTGIAGSTRIGKECRIGGACNIVGHIVITDRVVLNAASLVTRSINESGHFGSGTPLQPVAQWRRTYVLIEHLERLARRVRRLENNN